MSASGTSVVSRPETHSVIRRATSAFGELGVQAAERLTAQGIGVTVVDPRWVLPVPEVLVTMARNHELVVTVADGGRHGGFGSALSDVLRAAEVDVPTRDMALPQEFLAHSSRGEILTAAGLTAQDVARRVTEWAAALPGCKIVPSASRVDGVGQAGGVGEVGEPTGAADTEDRTR